jgi:hypothetical protein
MIFSDLIFENLVSVFGLQILKFFDADTDSGVLLTRDPGWKNSDPWFGINIPDPQHWSRGGGGGDGGGCISILVDLGGLVWTVWTVFFMLWGQL